MNPYLRQVRRRQSTVYARMGYLITLLLVIIAVPLLFILLSRRTARSGGRLGDATQGHGVTVEQPSSDQPTPGAESVPQVSSDAQRRVPPG